MYIKWIKAEAESVFFKTKSWQSSEGRFWIHAKPFQLAGCPQRFTYLLFDRTDINVNSEYISLAAAKNGAKEILKKEAQHAALTGGLLGCDDY